MTVIQLIKSDIISYKISWHQALSSLKHDFYFDQLSVIKTVVDAVYFAQSNHRLGTIFAGLSIKSRSKVVRESFKNWLGVIVGSFNEENSVRQLGLNKADDDVRSEACGGRKGELEVSEGGRPGGDGKGKPCGGRWDN